MKWKQLSTGNRRERNELLTSALKIYQDHCGTQEMTYQTDHAKKKGSSSMMLDVKVTTVAPLKFDHRPSVMPSVCDAEVCPFFTRSTDSTNDKMAWRCVCSRFKWDFSKAGSDGSVSMPKMMDAKEALSRSSGRTSTRTQRRSTQFSKKLRMATDTASPSNQLVAFLSRKVLIWLNGAAETAKSTRT